MLDHLRGRRVYDRKLRLFACALLPPQWEWLKDGASRRAVEFAERFADRRTKGHELAFASSPPMPSSPTSYGDCQPAELPTGT